MIPKVEELKRCSRCEREKPLAAFYVIQSRGKPWRMAKCAECVSELAKDWAKRNPAKKAAADARYARRRRSKRRPTTYGLGEFEFAVLEAASGGLCAICRTFVGQRRCRGDRGVDSRARPVPRDGRKQAHDAGAGR